MNKTHRRNLLIALGGALAVCCLAAVGLVLWQIPESPAAAAARQTTQTAATEQAGAAEAAANATGTAAFAEIDSRLQAAQPVFTDTLGADSGFVKQNAGGLTVSAQGGATQIDLPFNGSHVWPIGQSLSDFVAELDCQPMGSNAFCGIAYGDHPANSGGTFYASYYGTGGQCGFEDATGSATSTKEWSCTPPAAPAASGLNRLRVERFGNNLRFFVNGQQMDQRMLTNAGALSGGVGLFFGQASSDNSGVFYVTVANFNVSQLP